MKIKPCDSVELGQARIFDEVDWEVWSILPPHERFAKKQPNRVFYSIRADTIGFVVGPMDENGYFTMLLEDGTVTDAPINMILTRSRVM